MFGLFSNFNNRIQQLNTPVSIPQAVGQPHSAAPIGQHAFTPQGAVPTGPQGQHAFTPQGNVFYQQRQQQIASAQAQEAARQQQLAAALRQNQEYEQSVPYSSIDYSG